MTWTIDGPQGLESAKIAHLVIPYTQGKCLDIGCGFSKVWPSLIGIDSCFDYGGQRPESVDVVGEGTDLSLFANETMDGVFSSHFLEHVIDYKACLKEWWRVIKPGGHLTLYLPHKNLYPNIGTEGANPDHKHDYMPRDIIEAMRDIAPSWTLMEDETREKGNEYSFFQVYRKTTDGRHLADVWQRNPNGKKRALVIRYGAIGDAVIAASVLPLLKKEGFYITFNGEHKTVGVLKHDPHIDEFLIQGKDFVPNVQLGAYWKQIELDGRYDYILNLCESIEGPLLALPDRLNGKYRAEAKAKLMDKNYLEHTHDIAGVPHEFHQKFYYTAEELAWAKNQRKGLDGPVVALVLNGSSHHKAYPWMDIICAWLVEKTPAHVFLIGDNSSGKQLQDAILKNMRENGNSTARVYGMCEHWSLREDLTFCQVADCVVGPETGPMNCVAMEKMPKVIMLSHSSHENLTKHWKNTKVLTPTKSTCPCYPCHLLHYNWDNCVKVEETQAALCASSIRPEDVFEAIVESLGAKRKKKKRAKTAEILRIA